LDDLVEPLLKCRFKSHKIGCIHWSVDWPLPQCDFPC